MAQLVRSVPGPWDREDRFSNWREQFEAEDKAVAELMAVSRQATEDNPVGFILRFQVADGYAMYRVESVDRGVKLAHIPFGDAYQISGAEVRGMRLADVQSRLRQSQTLDRLFDR